MIPSLNYAVLTDALYALNEGNIHHCEKLGFTFAEMHAISQLSPDELFTLSRAVVPFITVSVHHEILQQLLLFSRQESHRQQQINRAIRLGGSISLLNHYFGLTSNEVCLRRRLLGVSIPYGRTPVPDEDTDAEIWRQWQKHHQDNPGSTGALETMMQITEALSSRTDVLSLTAVRNCITQCAMESTKKGGRYAG
ncbi:DUF2857 domain-containing protein [Klebsiella michiganensis]|uniref:DUF2857 domain-containing protein n=1 Tax=Klebsiella michiganensis TaxID=1134687 RepID=UPI0012B91D73|nr:DUF2857 domain-containing protein [Klebsiella michiganensis]